MSYASYSSLGKDPNAPPPESMAEIPHITSEEHRRALISKYHVVVIDNYTDWCGPCKIVAPRFAQLAQKYLNLYKGRVYFAKENVEDNHPGVPTVRGVPCFHFYVFGNHVKELTITGGNIDSVKDNLNKVLGSK